MAPLVDPGTDLEEEWPTPVGSPLSAVDECMPLSMTPETYPVPLVPMVSFGDSVPLEVAPPAGPAVGSPARSEALLHQVSSPSSPVLRPTTDVSPPSDLAAMDQELPWSASLPFGFSADSPLLPAPLTPSRMVERVVVPGSVVSSLAGSTDMAGGHQRMADLSLEGPFDVHQDRPVSGASPRVLDGMRGCQYHMTSCDQESGGPDFSPAYGIQLHDPRLLEYVSAPVSARLLSRSPEYWLHHLGYEKTLAAALQLQHVAGLILSNVQVLQQFVTSLNRTLSEVMRVAHYVAAMGLWWPSSSQGVWGSCRQRHAMPACRAATAFRICLSDSMDSM